MKTLIHLTRNLILPGLVGFFMLLTGTIKSQDFQKDVVKTSEGPLSITFVGHGSLMFEFNNYTIHVDPSTREADYGVMPDADMVLITHHHGDHFDREAVRAIAEDDTQVIYTTTCDEDAAGNFPGDTQIMKNGAESSLFGISIEAIPAYNLKHMRSNGEPYHPQGVGNGYIITFGNKKVYVAGDTENIPEMKSLEGIDIAFLPMNLPYTMTPEMVADAAKAFKPNVLYPYHYGSTDPAKLVELMKGEEEVIVKVRDM